MKKPAHQDAKPLTFEECLEKARHFCAYQERSKKQVWQKLTRLGIQDEWKEPLIKLLEDEDFINENRFQKAYIRGKARVKGWGPEKIRQKLFHELGRIPDEESESIEENEQASVDKLKKALDKKYQDFKKKQDPQWKTKLLRFCVSRGFDWDTSTNLVNEIGKRMD